jgi:hypothetical protein
MSGPRIAAIVSRFDSRLVTLQGLLDKAQAQWADAGKDAGALIDSKLADDMLPLANQILFTCQQPNQFLDWATGVVVPAELPATIADGAALIAATRARLKAFDGSDALLSGEKVISLPGNMGIKIDGATYVDDWLVPNFYFHFVTAYAILRREGVALGKIDYMAHLAPLVRPLAD